VLAHETQEEHVRVVDGVGQRAHLELRPHDPLPVEGDQLDHINRDRRVLANAIRRIRRREIDHRATPGEGTNQGSDVAPDPL